MPGCMPAGLGQRCEQAARFGDDGVRVDAALLQHRPHDAFFFLGQGDQQVEREQHLVLVLFGDALGLLQSFLRFLSEFVESKHIVSPDKT